MPRIAAVRFPVGAAVPYLDWNATAPLHPRAKAAWIDATERLWHNPSSLYAAATRARDALEGARETLADLLGCDPARIVFTSGATEANNALVRHVARTLAPDRRVAISPLEHPCVAEPFHAVLQGRVVELPVDGRGVVDPEDVAAAAPGLGFVSVIAAGNESGVLEPWEEIAAACRGRGIPFHTDAAQCLGRLPAGGLGRCDWVTGSGHKFGGPRGSGFLVVPPDAQFRADRGGPQEFGRRAGTEDVAGIVALVAALEACSEEPAARRGALAADRDAAERRLLAAVPGTVIVGGGGPRLWNTLAVVPPAAAAADARKTVARLAAAGVEASTGAACSAGAAAVPRVLAAIGAERLGIAADALRGMVRFSGGWETTAADWTAAIDALAAILRGDAAPLPAVRLPR